MHKSSNDEGEIAFAPWPHKVHMYVRMYVCLYPVSGWKVGLFRTGTGESPRTESLQLQNPTLIVHAYRSTYVRTYYTIAHPILLCTIGVTTHPHAHPHCRQTTDKGPIYHITALSTAMGADRRPYGRQYNLHTQ